MGGGDGSCEKRMLEGSFCTRRLRWLKDGGRDWLRERVFRPALESDMRALFSCSRRASSSAMACMC
jgi:hypothetical protein